MRMWCFEFPGNICRKYSGLLSQCIRNDLTTIYDLSVYNCWFYRVIFQCMYNVCMCKHDFCPKIPRNLQHGTSRRVGKQKNQNLSMFFLLYLPFPLIGFLFHYPSLGLRNAGGQDTFNPLSYYYSFDVWCATKHEHLCNDHRSEHTFGLVVSLLSYHTFYPDSIPTGRHSSL